MWLAFAVLSAFFAGITSVLSKVGFKNINSNSGTAMRTVVVFIFAWLMFFAAGAQSGISDITAKTLVFLVLSGIATGASWLCYSRALKYGDVNKVTPIDKSSPVLTMILAFVFLHEEITLVKFFCIILIGAGTYMMIEKKGYGRNRKRKIVVVCLGSVVRGFCGAVQPRGNVCCTVCGKEGKTCTKCGHFLRRCDNFCLKCGHFYFIHYLMKS